MAGRVLVFTSELDSLDRSKVIHEALYAGFNAASRTVPEARAHLSLVQKFEALSVPTVNNYPGGIKAREIVNPCTLPLTKVEHALLVKYLSYCVGHAKAATVALVLAVYDWVAQSPPEG